MFNCAMVESDTKLEMLLVRPRPPRRGTSFTAIRTLTLPSVAAAFSPWARVTLVEESGQPIPDGHFDLVGISCETILSRRAYQLARRFRAQGVPVIMGRHGRVYDMATHALLRPRKLHGAGTVGAGRFYFEQMSFFNRR